MNNKKKKKTLSRTAQRRIFSEYKREGIRLIGWDIDERKIKKKIEQTISRHEQEINWNNKLSF
jgi:hypothetical protein